MLLKGAPPLVRTGSYPPASGLRVPTTPLLQPLHTGFLQALPACSPHWHRPFLLPYPLPPFLHPVLYFLFGCFKGFAALETFAINSFFV